MTDTTTTDDLDGRPFAAVLHELDYGLVHDELTRALAEVAAGVRQHEKKGKLVLTLKLSPFSKAGAIEIDADIKPTVPEPDRDPTLLFVTDSGELVRNNPRQMTMDDRPLKAVDDTKEA